MSTGHIVFDSRRRTLQHSFYAKQLTDEDRDKIIADTTFKSIQSHSFDYHIQIKHDFIFIDCDDQKYINWVCNRFNNIYEVQNKSNPEIRVTPEYIKEITAKVAPHTNKIIPIRDILEGRLIDTLSKYVETPLNVDIYTKWLEVIGIKFPLTIKNQ